MVFPVFFVIIVQTFTPHEYRIKTKTFLSWRQKIKFKKNLFAWISLTIKSNCRLFSAGNDNHNWKREKNRIKMLNFNASKLWPFRDVEEKEKGKVVFLQQKEKKINFEGVIREKPSNFSTAEIVMMTTIMITCKILVSLNFRWLCILLFVCLYANVLYKCGCDSNIRKMDKKIIAQTTISFCLCGCRLFFIFIFH